MKSKHVIVLGAGITGLSTAWRLSDNGVKVDILEAERSIGGLSETTRENGCCMDFGPHSFFSEDQKVLDAVLRLFDNKLESRSRRVKFYNNGRYVDYPLTAESVIFQMGFRFGIQSAFSFLKNKLFPCKRTAVDTEEETVEDWAIASFGEYLYRMFFKPYTEQFWKVSCRELSSRAIPSHTRVNFMNTLRLLLHRKVGNTGESLIEREALPTYYPDTGFVEIAERMAEVIKKNNSSIHLDCEVVGINELPDGKMCVFYQCNGQRKEMDGDYIVSTIPLPLLVKMLPHPAPPEVMISADKLDYRALVVLGMLTQKQNVLSCGYIYLLDRPFNRIFEMNVFSPHTSPPEKNIIGVEIPCREDSIAWKATKEELFDMCIGSLAKEGFLSPGDVEELFLIKKPYTYPIYRKGYAVHLNRVLDYLKKYSLLTTLGRCAEFMYMDADQCIRKAFDFTDSLLAKYQQGKDPLVVSERSLGSNG